MKRTPDSKRYAPDRRAHPQTASQAALKVQREAADPTVSVVLQAAAGSGKTKVLVDRFIRLCLENSHPKSIMAVTFTRKAAVEIKERLLEQVKEFHLMSKSELDTALHELLGRSPTERERRRASRLFTEIIEDLPGLQVGTIHAFCQRVLGRFAAEVGLDPRFGVLDRDDQLWEEALDHLEREVASESDSRTEMATLAPTPAAARNRLTGLKHDRVLLERWLHRIREEMGDDVPAGTERSDGGKVSRSALVPALVADLVDTLLTDTPLAGIQSPEPRHLAGPVAQAVNRLADEGLARIAEGEAELTSGLQRQLSELRSRLRSAAASLAEMPGLTANAVANLQTTDCLRELTDALLTGGDKLRSLNGKRASKTSRQRLFAEVAAPVLQLLMTWRRLELLRWNASLLRFGMRALDIYDGLKRRDRQLDFQDLENLTWVLMRGELGPYVQYRFDRVLDHILVDEFQDTNRNQWEILEPFASEFLAGESAHGGQRTLFLVGDLKQSIYGFRGADPAIFTEVAGWLAHRGSSLLLSLPTNFRSLPAVVDTVGRLFQCEPLAGNWPSGTARTAAQQAARDEAAGRVVLLPGFTGGEELDGHQQAAQAAVAIVQHLTGQDPSSRPGASRYGFGDVLVLCRSRTHIGTYEQAFREAGIPIVPAGRGMLARSREVRDLLALLRWLSYPDDDVALASVLRSPLFRLDEATWQRLADRRRQVAQGGKGRRGTGSLWSVLRVEAADLGLQQTLDLLADWQSRVGFASSHDLLRTIYRTGHVLERFAAALGEQARFNLLRLMDLALSPELGHQPTLRRLVSLIHRAAVTAAEEEATPPAAGHGRVRLMTVHAAKGLESPVVLLVDTATPPRSGSDRLRLAPNSPAGPLLYGVRKEHAVGPELPPGAAVSLLGPLIAASDRAQQESRQEETDILYVALTRPRDEMYVLAAESPRTQESENYWNWLQQAASAAGESTSSPSPFSLELPEWLQATPVQDKLVATGAARPAPANQSEAALAEVRQWDPPPQRAAFTLNSPSQHKATGSLGAGMAPVSESSDEVRTDALTRGELMHRWLQLAAETGELPSAAADRDQETLAEASAVFGNPAFAWIFDPELQGGRGLCEVPFIHRLEARSPAGEEPEMRVMGVMDRLILYPDRVVIIDYKSDRVADPEREIPVLMERYESQLKMYRQAVQDLFPEREVHTHLLFTSVESAEGRGLLRQV